MNPTELALRQIKDRIASALGELEEAAATARHRDSYQRLVSAADEIHRSANELQTILMRLKTR